MRELARARHEHRGELWREKVTQEVEVRDREYGALVAARKACRICVERSPGRIRSCAEFDYDPDVVSLWELWLGHENPKLLVVGQDFGNVDYFVRNRGRDDPDNKTNANLWKLLAEAGIEAGHPRRRDEQTPVFLTNSVLCLKEGPMNGPVYASWVRECTARHLLPLLQWLQPPVVVGMGACGWRAVRQAFALSEVPRGISAAAGWRWTSETGTRVFAVGHCSPLGLINRSWRQQVLDWRGIGEAMASFSGSGTVDAHNSGSPPTSSGSHAGCNSASRVGPVTSS